MPTAYIFDEHVGNFHYGPHHPMKPHRIAITHSLVNAYKLDKHMDIIQPQSSSVPSFLTEYHSHEFIDSLIGEKEAVTDDCPVFAGLAEYCSRYSAGTMTAAGLLNLGLYDCAINWAGGLHHAKKTQASGFCYVNDIVLGIQELLRVYDRVLYIDIDIHHGDGVEEAFFFDKRVFTLSLHRFGQGFFPGTGELFVNGNKEGKYYCANVPFKQGIDDSAYLYMFKPIVDSIFERFDPQVVVMQCGADSLLGDRIGTFNLTIHGHGECVKYVKQKAKKLMVLGGGGYNVKNTARCWAYETGLLLDKEMENHLPLNVYSNYFQNDCYLHAKTTKEHVNLNSKKYLDVVRSYVLGNLSNIG